MLQLDDAKMSEFIDKLVSTDEIELGNNITYKVERSVFHSENQINYEQMMNNLWMIYGDEGKSEVYIALFDKMRHFVADGLHIIGLDRLFSQYYYNIEWNMYTEAKFD